MPDRDALHKMWGGRFQEALDTDLLDFTSSFATDRRLLRWDLIASIAHAQMLGATGIIPASDAEAIAGGLRAILADTNAGRLPVQGPYEDVHSFVEANLIQRLGPVAGRLHTARSRNDQVATAFRLYVKEEIVHLAADFLDLMETTVSRAAHTLDIILPGLTHMQHAQPVRLAHHLLAYVWMLDRDIDRLMDSYRRTDVLPLGSGAVAGVSYPVDRHRVAAALGFAQISDNSVDATGDRDFAMEVTAAAAMGMIHLSRWSAELILWASPEFGFITLSDSVATGSSMMPQKKNPDPVELIRGRAGRVIGALMALLTTLKGLPPGYQRDLQEDKDSVFQALDLTGASVRAMRKFLAGVEFSPARMEEATRHGFLTATEVADYLTRKGMPFREAHQVAGRVVQEAFAQGVQLWELSPDAYAQISPLFGHDILETVRLEAAVEAKRAPGGTAKAAVERQLDSVRRRLEERRVWVRDAEETLQTAAALAER